MTNEYYLFVWEEDYADEFDFGYWEIFTKTEVEELAAEADSLAEAYDADKLPEEIEVYFGTNEFFSWDTMELITLFQNYKNTMTLITEEEKTIIEKLFHGKLKHHYHHDAFSDLYFNTFVET